MRRGSILDYGAILIGVTSVIIGVALSWYISTQFSTAFIAGINNVNTSVGNSSLAVQLSTPAFNVATSTAGYLWASIPLIFLVLGIAAAIAAATIPTNPLYLPVSLIFFAVYIIVSGIFSNFWYIFMSQSMFSALTSAYPVTTWVIDNGPLMGLGIMALILIAEHIFSSQHSQGGNAFEP